jgi:hypothetical protein
MWLIGLYPFNFFPIKCVFIIWVLLIVFCKVDSCLTYCCAFLEVPNQNLNLKFDQMDFWFEFINIHMNENAIICHDCHGCKWQNINIYPILTIFLCGPIPFRLIVLWLHTFIQTNPKVPWYMHQIIKKLQGGNGNKHFVPHSWARSLWHILLCLLLWQDTLETHPCFWEKKDQASAPWIMRCTQPLATQFALPKAPALNWFGCFSAFGLWTMFDSWPIYWLVF